VTVTTLHARSIRRDLGDAKSIAIIVATALGFVLVQLDVSIVNVALGTIGRELHASVAGLQWVVDAYTAVFAALLLSGGALGDRIGARRAFIAGYVVFVGASIGCGVAPTAPLLIGARVLQGVGAALLIPGSLALVNHAFGADPRTRAIAIGLWTAAGSIALAAGPIVGGALIECIGWRSIFFVNVPLGGIGIWLTLRAVTETRAGGGAFDLPGQALAVATLGTLIAAVIAAGSGGWASPLVLGGFAAAAICSVAFVVHEARTSAPMLPLRLLARPPFSTAVLVGLAINFTFYGELFALSLFWERTQGFSPLRTGLAFLPVCVSIGVANVVAGRIVADRGPRPALIGGLAIAAIGYLLLTFSGPTTPYLAMLAGLLIFPFGIGAAVPAMTTALLASVPKERSGVASGVLNAARQSAGALGVAVIGALFAAQRDGGVRAGLLLSTALICAALVVAAVGLREKASG
jgi:DHA2 family methylenomycin A resistance protein-like MFS transporter